MISISITGDRGSLCRSYEQRRIAKSQTNFCHENIWENLLLNGTITRSNANLGWCHIHWSWRISRVHAVLVYLAKYCIFAIYWKSNRCIIKPQRNFNIAIQVPKYFHHIIQKSLFYMECKFYLLYLVILTHQIIE